MNADIAQLELHLEDLETNQAAAEPLPAQPAILAVNAKVPNKPARRPLPAELPRETETIAPKQESCPDCGGTLRPLGEDVSEILEYVPARFKVIRTVRPKPCVYPRYAVKVICRFARYSTLVSYRFPSERLSATARPL